MIKHDCGDGFERSVHFRAASDKRDGDPKKNYGIRAVSLRFIFKGPNGAIEFSLDTGWHLPHVQDELDSRPPGLTGAIPLYVGYHAYEPQYDGHKREECGILDGGHCYCDGSFLQAYDIHARLAQEGDDGVWAELEERYHSIFDGVRESNAL